MPVSVGVQFAHASLQVLAEESGIDLLHIKGPAVDDALLQVDVGHDPSAVGWRETVARRSIDADVLVRPSQVSALFAVMHRHAWTTSYRFEDGSAFEHAATMAHPFLAPVDVHRRFPGIDLDAERAFDLLWADRHDVLIAGRPCPVPSVTGQRLVLIIHAARGGVPNHPDIRRSWVEATDEQRREVERLAEDLHAEVALAAGTGRLHEFEGAQGYDLWLALSTRERSLPKVWLARVRAAPTPAAGARLAVHLLLPNRRRMSAALGRPPTARELARAYLARARQGARELSSLVRTRKPGRR
jgi:Uncharacterised nucleotidyltransferase